MRPGAIQGTQLKKPARGAKSQLRATRSQPGVSQEPAGIQPVRSSQEQPGAARSRRGMGGYETCTEAHYIYLHHKMARDQHGNPLRENELLRSMPREGTGPAQELSL